MTPHERLRLAREAFALDRATLAEATNISEEQLAAYEAGEEIQPDDLLNLGQTLPFGVAFLQETAPMVNLRPVSPRFNRLDDLQQKTLLAQGRIWLDRYNQIESLFADLPVRWSTPEGFPRHCETGLEASEAAELLRADWGLGSEPIRNVTYLLEDHGLKVGLVAVPGEFDACAFVSEDSSVTPLILIQRDLEDGHHRYKLSSELAYFLLDRATPQMTGHFAGGFLISSAALHRDLGYSRTYLNPLEAQFLTIKHGVSWRTLIARATVLRIIPKEHMDDWIAALQDDDDLGLAQADPSKIPMRMIELGLLLEAEGVLTEEQRGYLLNLPWLRI